MFENSTEELEKVITLRKAGDPTGESTPDSTGNPDILKLAEEITGLLDAGNITADVDKVSEWAQTKGLSAENAMDFAGSVIDAYLGDDEEAGEEDETDEHEEPDEDNMGGESDDDEDNEDEEETMKSGIKYLESLESQISNLTEQLEMVAKSQSVLAAGIHSIIEASEKNSEEMSLLKSKLGIIATTPVNPKNPVIMGVTDQTGDSKLNLSKSETKEFILKGSLAGKIKLEEIQYWETTGKLTQNMQNFIKESGK